MNMVAPENLLVVSDLHLNEGWLPEQAQYSPREDFFYDEALFALLRYHHERQDQACYAGRPWCLVFNGDTFDFEQVVTLPKEGSQLQRVCEVALYDELGDRKKYGLGTSSQEARWKLGCIARGHPVFFAALGWFVARGHRVILIKGNHDPELYWPQVQADFRFYVVKAYAAYSDDAFPLSKADVNARIQFEPWFYYDAHFQVYIEHGNQYEPSNHFLNYLHPTCADNAGELDLPQGMLMTRYVFNLLEDSYPYADNVRPPTRVFGWMLSDNPWRGTRVFLARARDLMRAWWWIGKRERSRSQRAPALQAQSQETMILPDVHHGLPRALLEAIQTLARARAQFSWQVWGRMAVDQGMLGILNVAGFLSGAWGLFSMLRSGKLRKAVQWWLASLALLNTGHLWATIANNDLRLDYMPVVARELAERFHAARFPLRAVILGHSHIGRREWLASEQVWMFNTGSWIPALIQHPFKWALCLYFVRFAAGQPDASPELLEWDRLSNEPRAPEL
ncbi:MAG: metallophosphoesterase [Anaerolineae bacterium]|nr:metallophosphoesterase [Anaerolineae bacterium]